jgi:chromosome segregation ATPase
MSEEHKAALAQGRRESRAVKKYLTALNSRRPGRPVTLDGLKKKIDSIDTRLENEEDPLKVLDLRQERLDAEDSLEELESREDLDELEKGFAAVAKSYSERKGISYTAWRQTGVPAAVLKKAGIPRTRRG